MEKQLGKLIVSLNPYTDAALKVMQFGHAGAAADAAAAVNAAASVNNAADFEFEIADKYAEMWSFKGESQKVNKAIRMKYRWPKLDPQDQKKILYWVTDYLLIGFEGTGGN
ncbi:MAG TPA: hypothetical protein VNV18_11950 [Stellaceae bacterium]|nr:hypothetical protein [Stellaceae bacterium]